MKITRTQLKQIIMEELSSSLEENVWESDPEFQTDDQRREMGIEMGTELRQVLRMTNQFPRLFNADQSELAAVEKAVEDMERGELSGEELLAFIEKYK